MTPEQTVKFIERRAELGLSSNEVARRAHLDPGAFWRIEQGMIEKPRADTLIAIARALDINPIELFTIVGWLTADDLPSLSTYLTAKFEGLSDAAVIDVEHYVGKALDNRSSYRGGPSPSERCPQQSKHCPQCPCAPKEH